MKIRERVHAKIKHMFSLLVLKAIEQKVLNSGCHMHFISVNIFTYITVTNDRTTKKPIKIILKLIVLNG